MNHEEAMRRAEELLSEDELLALADSDACYTDANGWGPQFDTTKYAREAIAAALVKYTQGQEAMK